MPKPSKAISPPLPESPRSQSAMADLHERSRSAGITCLNTQWLGCTHRYSFRCQHGHTWQRTAASQKRIGRCTACARVQAGLAGRKTDNLIKLHALARARGGVCLTEQYLGARARYRFRCRAGHEWDAAGEGVLGGNWCRRCAFDAKKGIPKSNDVKLKLSLAQRMPDGLQRLQQLAQARGGQCLSEDYLGSGAHHRFKCAQGHEWNSLATNIVSGKWCRQCRFAAQRLTLEDAQQAAHARGGRCLSAQYVNNNTYLMWECDRGHVWNAPLSTIRNHGSWCAQCGHLSQISRRQSKAHQRYADGAKHIMKNHE